MMQARWGSHGHYEIIALAPSSPQELFYQTIDAFNLSETYRVPVLIMTDEMIGHLSERVVIPEAKAIHTVSRPRAKGRKDRFKPFEPGPNGVAPMAIAGEGYRVHITGLTHDERGYPDMTVEGQEVMMGPHCGQNPEQPVNRSFKPRRIASMTPKLSLFLMAFPQEPAWPPWMKPVSRESRRGFFA